MTTKLNWIRFDDQYINLNNIIKVIFNDKQKEIIFDTITKDTIYLKPSIDYDKIKEMLGQRLMNEI